MSKSKVSKRTPAANKKKKAPSTGRVVINATFSNTIITVTSLAGDTVAWSSGGCCQKNSRKRLGPTAEDAAKLVGQKVVAMGMNSVHVVFRGPGQGRDPAVKGLANAGLFILTLTEDTGMPFNGVRVRKEKRN